MTQQHAQSFFELDYNQIPVLQKIRPLLKDLLEHMNNSSQMQGTFLLNSDQIANDFEKQVVFLYHQKNQLLLSQLIRLVQGVKISKIFP